MERIMNNLVPIRLSLTVDGNSVSIQSWGDCESFEGWIGSYEGM